MKRVVLVTNHYLNADRKAGFHWLAEAFWRAGWHVTFFTESISWLSYLGKNERCRYPLRREQHRLHYVRDRLASYVWLTPFHPIHLRSSFLNRLARPVFKQYARFPLGEAEPQIARADLFIFDSDHGLFLFDRFKALNPRARYVYRVSDDIHAMGHHHMLPEQEARIIGRFDLVSAPAGFVREHYPTLANLELHRHGLQKELFDRLDQNPYATPKPNVLFVGKHGFDTDFLMRALRLFPDWSFHVFGNVGPLPRSANLTCHGERPFRELIPYLQHADIGLQCVQHRPGAETLTDRLKMFQYTSCRLPIL